MKVLLLPIAWCLLVVFASGQERAAADTLHSITPGSGQNTGQGPAFFPHNVLGFPAAGISDTVPVTDPRQICSIGLDGEIIVGFRDRVIIDGPGADLVVYENAFRYSGSRIYVEPGAVSVSRDGRTWVEFPWDSLTLQGCAGVTPGTGDAFDLADVGLDSVRWVKIRDVTRVIIDNEQHPYYDPTLTGFDLDAVVSDHTVRVATTNSVLVLSRSTTIDISVADAEAELLICDVRGAILHREFLARGVHQRVLDHYVQVCLLVMLRGDQGVATVKVLP